MLLKCSKITCSSSMKNARLTTNSLPPSSTPCVRSKRPRVYRHHAHTCFNMCAWCRYTRGRFGRTHKDVLSGHTGFFSAARPHHTPHTHTTTQDTTQDDTPQHTTATRPQQHTETETCRDRERERDRERRQRRQDNRREKRDDSFSVWWCMAVLC